MPNAHLNAAVVPDRNSLCKRTVQIYHETYFNVSPVTILSKCIAFICIDKIYIFHDEYAVFGQIIFCASGYIK